MSIMVVVDAPIQATEQVCGFVLIHEMLSGEKPAFIS